jgi:hypothetical protein
MLEWSENDAKAFEEMNSCHHLYPEE